MKHIAILSVVLVIIMFTARCVTCKTVEVEAKADIENLYGGKVKFQSVNLDMVPAYYCRIVHSG